MQLAQSRTRPLFSAGFAVILVLCVPARGAGQGVTTRLSGGAQLAGFTGDGRVVVVRPDGSIEGIPLDLEGPKTTLTGSERWMPATLTTAPVGGVRFELEVDRAPGSRPSATLIALTQGEQILMASVPWSSAQAPAVVGWALSPSKSHAVVVLRYGDAGAGLKSIALPRVRSRAKNQRALKAFANGRPAQAAALWEEAQRLDPSFGDPVYNLACVHAQQGDLDRAAQELTLALALNPTRLSRLARFDPDLEPLRASGRLDALLGAQKQR